MANPMMQMLSGGRSRPSNPLVMVAEFRRFAAGMTPQKAEAEIRQMLSDGRMSQDQFAQLQEQAKAFAQFLR